MELQSSLNIIILIQQDPSLLLAAFTERLPIANRISSRGSGIVTARGRNTLCKLNLVYAVAGPPR